ncbi:MAG: hypothetical protein QOJ50_3620, partial [Cryptosporangiaceae bacterium]|nr:hypothetical protein [Cryptosporangiaceae bacterium]
MCTRCHTAGGPADRFCGRCGSALLRRCPSCGSAVGLDTSFCTSCGHALTSEEPEPQEPAADRLEERRVVTIVFADLAGFTELGEELDPEDVRALQSTYFNTVSRLIQRRGGVVEKYIGDAVMAVFGAPLTQEDDAARAVRAGLELQEALDRRLVGPREPLRVRVGVATGVALVDLGALHNGGQALVSGDVVNTAARLQAHAPPGSVLVSAATWRASAQHIEYAKQPPLRVRGKSGTVRTWLARGLIRRRWNDAPDAGTFVNRNAELDVLQRELELAVAHGHARLVCLIGPAGIGKSRLIRELSRRGDPGAHEVDWFGGRCLPPGEGTPYSALADIVRSITGVTEADDEPTARAEVTAALAGLFESTELPRMVEALGRLAGYASPDLSAEETENAWLLLFARLAQRRPTVLVFEDLYWGDPVLLRFVTRLAAGRVDAPLLVIATFRPDTDTLPYWADTVQNLTTVRLDALSDQHTTTLFRELLGENPLPSSTVDRLTVLSGGTPLYAHEYVRMLADRGEASEDTAIGTDGEIPLPDTVHAVIASRIDLLEMRARRTLQAAAVVGPTFWPGAVATVAGLSRAEVNRTFVELARREFIRPANEFSFPDEPAFAFTHALVRDLAYGRQPRAARLVRHQHAARWLERHAGARTGDTIAALANHRVTALDLAGLLNLDLASFVGPARTALVAAAEQSASLHAVAAALNHLDRALALWPSEVAGPAGDEVARLRALVLRRQLQLLADAHAFFAEDGPGDLARLADRQAALGAEEAAARTWTLLGNVEWHRADRSRALDHLNRALGIFDRLPDSAEKAAAYAEFARLRMTDYDTAPAIAAARTAAAMGRRLRLLEIEANALVTEGTARYMAGDPDGLALLEEAVELCRKEQLRALRRAAMNLGVALQEEGDIARSYALGDESSAQVIGDTSAATLNYSHAAERAYFAGEWALTLSAAEEYLAKEVPDSAAWEALALRLTCGVLRVCGGGEPGVDIAHCIAEARRGGFRPVLAQVLALGALCHALHGDRPGAAAYLQQIEAEVPESVSSREWLPTAAHAACLSSGERCRSLKALLSTVTRPTLWVRAAIATLDGGIAAHDGTFA